MTGQIVRKKMGGRTNLAAVTTYVPAEWKEALEKWASEEDRSISWIVSKLIEDSLRERGDLDDE